MVAGAERQNCKLSDLNRFDPSRRRFLKLGGFFLAGALLNGCSENQPHISTPPPIPTIDQGKERLGKIAYLSSNWEDIWLIDIDAGSKKLIDSKGSVGSVEWSADGRFFLIHGSISYGKEAWKNMWTISAFDENGSQTGSMELQKRLLPGEQNIVGYSWIPGNKGFLYQADSSLTGDYKSKHHRYNYAHYLASEEETELFITDSELVIDPKISPDGKKFVFANPKLDDEENLQTLQLYVTDFNPQKMPYLLDGVTAEPFPRLRSLTPTQIEPNFVIPLEPKESLGSIEFLWGSDNQNLACLIYPNKIHFIDTLRGVTKEIKLAGTRSDLVKMSSKDNQLLIVDKPGVLRIFNLQGQEVSVVTLPRPDFDIQTVYNLRWSSKNPTISFLQDRNLYLANLDGSNMRFVNLAEFLTNIPGDNRNKEYSGSYLRRRINPQPF